MPKRAASQVLTRHHRGHRLEIRDDGGDGWLVVLHGGGGGGAPPLTLRTGAPGGLGALVDEARRRIDRRLDGGRELPGGR